MNENITLYDVLETGVTNVEKICEMCNKTQSDFNLSLLDTAIPSNLDLPIIREIILQRKSKVQTTPHTQVLELLHSFPENTVHVITLPHIDPNAKLFIGKSNECEGATLLCLLINGVYAGSYTATFEDAELYFNNRLCNFESLIDMLEVYDKDVYGELNLSPISKLPVKELSGYVPLVVRKFMAPYNSYDNFANEDYRRFIKWAQTHLNQKLMYDSYPDSHMVIAKTNDSNPAYYIAVKNGDQIYRTMSVRVASDGSKLIELMINLFTDNDSEISLPNRLAFDSDISRTPDVTTRHLEILLSNLDN